MQQKIQTATNMYPGRLVIKGTNDDEITVCGAAGACIGWLGYEQPGTGMPTTVDTIYAADAQAPVLYGGGFVVVASLAVSQTISKGDRLVAAADGRVSEAAAATVTAGIVDVTSDAATATIDGTVPADGIVIGIAMQTITTDGSTNSDILVLSLI
jgi:hypothetical protein